MIDLKNIKHIFLYPGCTDMRLGLYGLRKLILETSELEEKSLYIFCGHKLNQIKIIEVEKYSTWLYQNKLNKGKFIWPQEGEKTDITKEQIKMILEGITFVQRIERQKIKKDLF